MSWRRKEAKSQGFGNHDISDVEPEYFGPRTLGVKRSESKQPGVI